MRRRERSAVSNTAAEKKRLRMARWAVQAPSIFPIAESGFGETAEVLIGVGRRKLDTVHPHTKI